MKELTDQFLEFFSKPENQNGFMWRMIQKDILPEGVDRTPEVLSLIHGIKVYMFDEYPTVKVSDVGKEFLGFLRGQTVLEDKTGTYAFLWDYIRWKRGLNVVD